MGWEKLSAKPAYPAHLGTGVTASLTKWSKSPFSTLSIGLNQIAIDQLEWNAKDRIEVQIGTQEHHGMIRLRRMKDGAIQLRAVGRKANAVLVHLGPLQNFVARREFKQPCMWERIAGEDAIEIVLPSWADETGPAKVKVALPPPPVDRGAATRALLEADEETAHHARSAREQTRTQQITNLCAFFDVTEVQAEMVLCVAVSAQISKKNVHSHLYGDRPDGGPEVKILDVQLSKCRRNLAARSVEISTRTQNYWSMERPSRDIVLAAAKGAASGHGGGAGDGNAATGGGA